MNFEKWQGCGNDFIVVERGELAAPLEADAVRRLCDRRFGVGADGILVVGEPTGRCWPVAIHNADGSMAESCGNGSRCVGRYLLDRHGGDMCELATAGGIVRVRKDGDEVGVAIAAPRVGAAVRIGGAWEGSAVDTGNAHVVVFVDDPATAPLAAIARDVRAERPDANVGVAAVRARDAIELRVDERGAGETLACGTGACAAVAVAAARGDVDESVGVRVRGGALRVIRAAGHYELWGPAERVYRGTL